MADYRSPVDQANAQNYGLGNTLNQADKLAQMLAQKQAVEQAQVNDMAKQQAMQQHQDQTFETQRNADIADVQKLRNLVGKDAKINAGHVTIDPREEAALGLTPGQKAADVAFGKEYSDYQAGGGKAGVQKNIKSLDNAIGNIKKTDKYDRLTGFLPRSLREMIAPSSVATEDAVKGTIQQTLRQTLGAQFTEREGQAIMDRAYNPRLSPDENLKRATAIAGELKAQAAQKEHSSQVFERTGSLRGLNAAGNSMQAAQPMQQPPTSEASSAPVGDPIANELRRRGLIK